METKRDDLEHARENAKGWLASIEEMLDAPYKAAAEREGWTGPHKDQFGATYYQDTTDNQTWAAATFQALCQAFHIEPNDKEREDAEQTVHESVLSVQVRDAWRSPGEKSNGADEYEILLTTGGPGLRIWGTVNEHGEPETAALQMQDCGTPWTPYPTPEATLLAFAQEFYFGE